MPTTISRKLAYADNLAICT